MNLLTSKHVGEISERGCGSITKNALPASHLYAPSHHLRTIIYPDSFPIN